MTKTITINPKTLETLQNAYYDMTIFKLREKYNLHMKVERYISDDDIPEKDEKFIRK